MAAHDGLGTGWLLLARRLPHHHLRLVGALLFQVTRFPVRRRGGVDQGSRDDAFGAGLAVRTVGRAVELAHGTPFLERAARSTSELIEWHRWPPPPPGLPRIG